MFFITLDTWRKNGVEVRIVDGIKWLNEWNIKEQLRRVNFRYTSRQYSSKLIKQRKELQECIKQPCRRFLRLGFNQHDPIITQEQSVLTKLDKFFKTEDKIFQHYVLGYRVDMYVPEYRLAIEVDELSDCTRDIKNEIERQEKMEKELGCKFIRIDPSRENFDIVDELCRIKKHI